MRLICLTRTKLGFQIPHDKEIKPLNGFPKAIFIAGAQSEGIELSIRISNRLLTQIYKMLLHGSLDPEMLFFLPLYYRGFILSQQALSKVIPSILVTKSYVLSIYNLYSLLKLKTAIFLWNIQVVLIAFDCLTRWCLRMKTFM